MYKYIDIFLYIEFATISVVELHKFWYYPEKILYIL